MKVTSRSVSRAFRRSAPFVKRLSAFRGPYETPEVSIVERVCATLWERKGKNLRSHLVYWFGELYGQDPEALHLYAWAAEAIHTATLLHDDVIDKADTRRGRASANALFDNTLPILSGDYLLGDAVYQVADRGHPVLLQRLCRTLKDLVSGECLQYEMRYRIPKEEDHFAKVTRLKTTSLLLWCAVAGPTVAGADVGAVERFLSSFGQLYQFTDDLLDVVGTETKDRWVDLRQGTLNHVTMMLLGDPELRSRIHEDFATKEVSAATIAAFEESVESRSFEPVTARLQELARDSERLAEALPHGATQSALKGLVRLCADRCA